MARFYGWTDQEINALPWGAFLLYLRAIDNISAVEDLRACSVASFGNSNLKKEARANTIRELKKAANQGFEIAVAKFADVAKAFAQGLKKNGGK